MATPWMRSPDEHAAYTSEGAWKTHPHLALIGRRVADAVWRGGGRLLVSIPPRHGKSELISFRTPVWALDFNPAFRLILTSYGDELARNWGRRVRNEIVSSPHMSVKLIEDSKAANRWNTPQGGGMVTAGIGGPITGFGADLIIVDDPCKNWQDATSRTLRLTEREWFNTTLYTRLEPNATIVVLMARWTEDDLVGWLQEEHADNWEVIRLPAMAEAGDLLGRQPGEALWPGRFDREALDNIRAAMLPHQWDALYQQAPTGYGPGRLYDQFDPVLHLDSHLALDPALPLQLSLDFNISPGMHGIIGQHNRRADQLIAHTEIHGPRMSTRALAEAFGVWLRTQGYIPGRPEPWPWSGELEVFGDASGHSGHSSTGESDYAVLAAGLQRLGVRYRMRVPKSNPPIIDRVNAVNWALKDANSAPHYHIHPRCERLIEDMRRMPRAEGVVIDKHDEALSHSSSAEGYRIWYLRPVATRRIETRDRRVSV